VSWRCQRSRWRGVVSRPPWVEIYGSSGVRVRANESSRTPDD
jgi:hypothetical protein